MGDPRYRIFPVGCDPAAPAFQPTGMPFIQPPIYNPYPCTPPPPFPFHDGSAGYLPYGLPPAFVNVVPPPATSTTHIPPTVPRPSRPTRTLVLSSVPPDVSESDIRRELEVFGDVRAVQMGRLREGIVTVHFYDLRHAQAAMNEIRAQHMQQQSRLRHHFDAVSFQNSHNYPFAPHIPFPIPPPAPGLICGHVVWALYTVPSIAGVPNGLNQGTLVVFNLNPNVCVTVLRNLFEAYGRVRELRATPAKCQQKFVEFYDVRDAAKALAEMNGKEIGGRNIVIEYSRPGGHNARRRYFLPPPPPPPPVKRSPNVEEIEIEKLRIDCQSRNKNVIKKITKKGYHHHDLGGGGGSSSSSNSSNNVNLRNSNYNSSGGGGGCSSSRRPLKGRNGGKRLDPRFQINGDPISSDSNCRDTRTTVMIKNIPNKYNQKLLLNMLDNHCIHCNEQIAAGGGGGDEGQPLSAYDFVYLPIDFVNKCNVGYGFVNMTSPEATWRLYKAFHLQKWEVFNSQKICEVTYARLQGLEALKDHFRSSKFPCHIDEYLPVVFSPARDGRQQTEPTPVAGCTEEEGLTPTVSSKASEDGETKSGGDFNHSCCYQSSSSSRSGGDGGSQNDGGDSGCDIII